MSDVTIDIRVIPKECHFPSLLLNGFSGDIKNLSMKSGVRFPITHIAKIETRYYLLLSTDVELKPLSSFSSMFPEYISSSESRYIFPALYAPTRIVSSYHPYSGLVSPAKPILESLGSQPDSTLHAHLFLRHPSMALERNQSRVLFHFASGHVSEEYFNQLPKISPVSQANIPSLFL